MPVGGTGESKHNLRVGLSTREADLVRARAHTHTHSTHRRLTPRGCLHVAAE